MPSTPPNERSRAVQLGAELRDARKRAELTLKNVAEALGRDHSTLSRWESGTHKPDVEDVSAVLAILGITGEERNRILELARHDGVKDWVAPGIERQLAALIEHEGVAELITAISPLLIPGLLQTKSYARSIMLSIGLSHAQAEKNSVIRLGRQNVLTRVKPVNYIAIIGEQSIRYPAASKEVMTEQLHHLLLMAKRPNVTIQVLPLDLYRYTPALEGRFILLEFPRDNPVVQVDSYWSTSTITNTRAVESYRNAAEAICHDAMGAGDSYRLISQVLKDMEKGT
jgi:transcriptional regulator with XRE-family HTH domain